MPLAVTVIASIAGSYGLRTVPCEVACWVTHTCLRSCLNLIGVPHCRLTCQAALQPAAKPTVNPPAKHWQSQWHTSLSRVHQCHPAVRHRVPD